MAIHSYIKYSADSAPDVESLPDDFKAGLMAEKKRFETECLRRFSKDRRTILLVGGAGYIGSVLTSFLLDRGYRVRCLDLLLYDNKTCIEPHLDNENYEFFHGDLANPEIYDDALQGVTDVVLLAGLVGDPVTKKYPQASGAINDHGILCFIDGLRDRGLNKLIFISTCSNYGLIADDQLADEEFELSPLSLYAKAKVKVENEVLALKARVDFHATVLRFATAFGLSPRMRFDLTVNEFTRELFLKKDLLVYDAHTWRPYCHVQDFCALIHRVLLAPLKLVSFDVFNAGGEVNNYTKQMIVDEVLKLNPGAVVNYKQHGSDPRNYKVSFKKVRERLLFEPEYFVTDGIKEIMQAMQTGRFLDIESQKNFYGNYEIDYQVRRFTS